MKRTSVGRLEWSRDINTILAVPAPSRRGGARPPAPAPSPGLTTSAGALKPLVPRLRRGSTFRSLIERRRQVDRVLFAGASVHGVSTRKAMASPKAPGRTHRDRGSSCRPHLGQLHEDVAVCRGRPLADPTIRNIPGRPSAKRESAAARFPKRSSSRLTSEESTFGHSRIRGRGNCSHRQARRVTPFVVRAAHSEATIPKRSCRGPHPSSDRARDTSATTDAGSPGRLDTTRNAIGRPLASWTASTTSRTLDPAPPPML